MASRPSLAGTIKYKRRKFTKQKVCKTRRFYDRQKYGCREYQEAKGFPPYEQCKYLEECAHPACYELGLQENFCFVGDKGSLIRSLVYEGRVGLLRILWRHYSDKATRKYEMEKLVNYIVESLPSNLIGCAHVKVFKFVKAQNVIGSPYVSEELARKAAHECRSEYGHLPEKERRLIEEIFAKYPEKE